MRINQKGWRKGKRRKKEALRPDSLTCGGTPLSQISLKSRISRKPLKETALLNFSLNNQIKESPIRVEWLKGLSNYEFKSF